MHKNASFHILISWWIFLGWDCCNLSKFYISLVIRKRKGCKNKTRKKKMRVMEKGYNHGDSHPTMEFPSVFQESYKSRKWACFHHWWNNIGRGFWLACVIFHICLILCSTIAFWQLTEWGSSCSIIDFVNRLLGCGAYGWRDPHCSLPQLNQIWSLSSQYSIWIWKHVHGRIFRKVIRIAKLNYFSLFPKSSPPLSRKKMSSLKTGTILCSAMC